MKYYSYNYTKSYELWGIHFLRGIIIIMGLKHPVYGTTSTRNNEKKKIVSSGFSTIREIFFGREI